MQQVNLYAAQFPPGEKIKVSWKLSSIIIIVAVVLIAAASVSYWKIDNLRKEYLEYQKSVSFTQRALNKVRDELNQSANEDKLKIDLLNIKDELRHKQALKDQLEQESVDISTSFYSRFLALSNQDVKGLWLSEIEFSDRGQKITLTGATRNAGLFTLYLQKLSKEPIFSGVTFSVLQLDTGDGSSPSDVTNFIISTDELPIDEAPTADTMQGAMKLMSLQK